MESSFSVDSGSTWKSCDRWYRTDINFKSYLGVLHPEYSGWGDNSIAGGVAGDYVKVDSIIANDSTTNEDLVAPILMIQQALE